MKTAHDIIIQPIITEQSAYQSMDGQYTFKVARAATKPEIAQAVEQLFQVKVLRVNKRQGMTSGRKPDYKKAVVTIDMEPASKSWKTSGGETQTSDKKYKTSIEDFGFGI